jgi:hypothetical protein
LANQSTDNRTDIADGTSATGWEDISGAALAVDTEIAYDTFSGSIGQYVTTTRDATLYNNGSTGLFSSGDVAYLLINCGVVSLLDTKALGGCTVRVTGATATDWKEVELFGSDDWPAAFSGGWVQIVVDIDDLLANFDNQNGTPPTVGNIQRFGVTFVTASVMPRMADNFWAGGFRILPANTPAIIVEGRDGGTTDWNWASISAVAAIQLSAVLLPGPGGSFVCRGPIQFGINDTSIHGFTESNKPLLWDTQQVMVDGFYGLSALGNSGGTTNVVFGAKTGTGAAATGAQGGAIQADPALGTRWFMNFDDANLDSADFYGVTMQYGSDFQMDDIAVEAISNLFIDTTGITASNSNAFLKNSYIAPNTAADGGALIWNENVDVDGILDASVFEQGATAHHAIQFGTAVTTDLTLRGLELNGFSGTDDVDGSTFQFLATAGALNLSLIDCTVDGVAASSANVGVDDAAGITVTLIIQPVTLTITVKDADTLAVIQNVQTSIHLKDSPFTELMNEDTTAGGIATQSYSGTVPVDVVWKCRKSDDLDNPRYKAQSSITTITTNGLELTVLLVPNPVLN